MARILKSDSYAVHDRNGPVVINADELSDGFVGILRAIERLDRWQAAFGALFRNECGVIALNLRGVLEHDTRQVPRGKSAEDIPIETLTAKIGQVAAVVYMCMAQNDCVQPARVKRELAVSFD